MNKDFYMLANEIADPMDGTDNAASFFQKQPDDAVTEQYRNHMLAAIRQEKAQKRRRRLPAFCLWQRQPAFSTTRFRQRLRKSTSP